MADELIRRAHGGDKAALNELLTSERNRVRNFCRRRLGTFGGMLPEKASEIAQSVLAIAAKRCEQGKLAQMGSRYDLRAYINGIATKKVASLCRKERRRREIKAPAAVEGAKAQTTSSESAAHRNAVVNRVIQQLEDPLEQDIAVLISDGCQFKDIPSRLRPKHGNVSRHKIDRTREKLKRRLEREDSTLRSR